MATYVSTDSMIKKVFKRRIVASFGNSNSLSESELNDLVDNSTKDKNSFAYISIKSELDLIDCIITLASDYATEMGTKSTEISSKMATDIASTSVNPYTASMVSCVSNIYGEILSIYTGSLKAQASKLLEAAQCHLLSLGLEESDFMSYISPISSLLQ